MSYGTPQWRRRPVVLEDIDELRWLAGWLEGEGSFIGPKPSNPTPGIVFSSTDEDVIEHASLLLGSSYSMRQRVHPDYVCKPVYSGGLRSYWAVEVMLALWPLMGQRRKSQIDAALTAWSWFHEHRCEECGGLIPKIRSKAAKTCSPRCARVRQTRQMREYNARARANA